MKYFLVMAALLPSISFASVLTECGEYNVKGVVRGGVGLSIILNEKTQSEYTLKMSGPLQASIGVYLNQDITAKVLMSKHINPVTGEITKIISIERRIPNPLNPEDTGFTLINKMDCSKE